MRFEIVRELFLKDVRETLRDRRSLLLMFGIPLLLYPLLTLGVAGVTAATQRRMQAQPTRLTVVNSEAAPHLLARILKSKGDFRLVTPKDPSTELSAGKIDAVLILPLDCEADALAARPGAEIRVQLDRSRNTSELARRRLDDLLQEYEQWVIEQRLKARGFPASLVRPLKVVTDDVATANQRMGRLLALLLPMILLVTGMLGAFGPAVNAITSERELGTLETLLVTPARKIELLAAKGALVLLACLMTAGINLLSMSLVLWRTVSLAEGAAPGAAGGAFTLDAGALALSFLAAVPTLIFFAGAVLVVVLAARNFREANAYATFLFLLPMAPMFVSMWEPKTTPALLLTPMVNTTLIIRDVLTDRAGMEAFLLAFASSTLYATLMLSVAARLFSTEELVSTSWEPLLLKGFRRGMRRKRRLPAVDEALALFAVQLLLLIYLSPAFQRWGFVGIVAGNELLLITAPTLLFAWMFRYHWRETFAWRRASGAELIGAALIGMGVLPWVYGLAALQQRFWQQDPETARATMQLLFPALMQHPLLTALAVGLLAGVCEELLYRGPIQTALARRLPAWLALGFGAFLFAVAHLDIHGLLFRTGLGVLLGWIVLRGGSIFPAMVTHAVADAVHFGLLGSILHEAGPQGSTNPFEIAARFSAAFAGSWGTWLALGSALLLLGFWLLLAGQQRRALQERCAPPDPRPCPDESAV